MNTMIKRRSTKSILATLLMAILVFTGAFSMTASAKSFYQGGDVFTGGTYNAGDFSTSPDNRLTVSAMAEWKRGTPTAVALTLQKYEGNTWTNVAYYRLPVDATRYTAFKDVVVNPNATYRILCVCQGEGANMVTIGLGIATYSI
ncbi:MAG: hypothetical protein PHP54_02110 [Clostridia bacterium]|nr:hypothetical protein [Clostridia bacterium]